MRSYSNPFLQRVSEQNRDPRRFLRTFGPGALNLLPEGLWDRLVVLRSAPGFGKTSLMRLFAFESLSMVPELGGDELKALTAQLEKCGALRDGIPQVRGIHVPVSGDFPALVDVGAPATIARSLFFRLLDARILVAFISTLFPDGSEVDAASVSFRPEPGDVRAKELVEHLGGPSGQGLLEYCSRTERETLALLDSLAPVDWDDTSGHSQLYSLQVLSRCTVCVDDVVANGRPLVMFDDAHELRSEQRGFLFTALSGRDLEVGRWIAERHQALTHEELLEGCAALRGGDYVEHVLEEVARESLRRTGGFDRVLLEIANRRAAPLLARYAHTDRPFTDFLAETGRDEAQLVESSLDRLRREAQTLAPRYAEWASALPETKSREAAIRWRELLILVEKDKRRQQRELFTEQLPAEDLKRLSGSGLRAVAALMLLHEDGVPLYFGARKLAKLGSYNVEQFLNLCGALFEYMLAEITLLHEPTIAPKRQELILREESRRYWEEIPKRVPFGRDVQLFVRGVVAIAAKENLRPTAPYPPGVTGTAMLMSDRKRLLDPGEREKIPGAPRLYVALAHAVAHNVVTVELDRSSKGKDVMVIYLNRLLCPQFKLPLGRGGFRERRLEAMSAWLLPTASSQGSLL